MLNRTKWYRYKFYKYAIHRRNQPPSTYFATLEDLITADNSVRLIDAFIDKFDLPKFGFTNTQLKK